MADNSQGGQSPETKQLDPNDKEQSTGAKVVVIPNAAGRGQGTSASAFAQEWAKTAGELQTAAAQVAEVFARNNQAIVQQAASSFRLIALATNSPAFVKTINTLREWAKEQLACNAAETKAALGKLVKEHGYKYPDFARTVADESKTHCTSWVTLVNYITDPSRSPKRDAVLPVVCRLLDLDPEDPYQLGGWYMVAHNDKVERESVERKKRLEEAAEMLGQLPPAKQDALCELIRLTFIDQLTLNNL